MSRLHNQLHEAVPASFHTSNFVGKVFACRPISISTATATAEHAASNGEGIVNARPGFDRGAGVQPRCNVEQIAQLPSCELTHPRIDRAHDVRIVAVVVATVAAIPIPIDECVHKKQERNQERKKESHEGQQTTNKTKKGGPSTMYVTNRPLFCITFPMSRVCMASTRRARTHLHDSFRFYRRCPYVHRRVFW